MPVLALSVSGGCLNLSLDELDELNRSLEVETILIRDDFTVYSPFGSTETTAWAWLVRRELDLVAGFFRPDNREPIAIFLETVEDWTPSMQLHADGVRVYFPPQGLLGWADGDVVVVRVAPGDILLEDPNGGEAQKVGGVPAELYAETLRHELAHTLARRAGLSGPRWFSEGLAELVEALPEREGRLERGAPAPGLRHLATLTRSQRRLADILDWDREDPSLEEQPPTRPLAYAFLRFLLEDVPFGDWLPALADIADESRASLLARESDWQAWIESFGS